MNEDGLKGLANAMEGIYFAKGTLASRREQLLGHECRPADGHRF